MIGINVNTAIMDCKNNIMITWKNVLRRTEEQHFMHDPEYILTEF